MDAQLELREKRQVEFHVFTGSLKPNKVRLSVIDQTKDSTIEEIECGQTKISVIWKAVCHFDLNASNLCYKYSIDEGVSVNIWRAGTNSIRCRELTPDISVHRDILYCPKQDLNPSEICDGLILHLENLIAGLNTNQTVTQLAQTSLKETLSELEHTWSVDGTLFDNLAKPDIRLWISEKFSEHVQKDEILLFLCVLYGSLAKIIHTKFKDDFQCVDARNVLEVLENVHADDLTKWSILHLKETCIHLLQATKQYHWLHMLSRFPHLISVDEVIGLKQTAQKDQISDEIKSNHIIPKIKRIYPENELQKLALEIPELKEMLTHKLQEKALSSTSNQDRMGPQCDLDLAKDKAVETSQTSSVSTDQLLQIPQIGYVTQADDETNAQSTITSIGKVPSQPQSPDDDFEIITKEEFKSPITYYSTQLERGKTLGARTEITLESSPLNPPSKDNEHSEEEFWDTATHLPSQSEEVKADHIRLTMQDTKTDVAQTTVPKEVSVEDTHFEGVATPQKKISFYLLVKKKQKTQLVDIRVSLTNKDETSKHCQCMAVERVVDKKICAKDEVWYQACTEMMWPENSEFTYKYLLRKVGAYTNHIIEIVDDRSQQAIVPRDYIFDVFQKSPHPAKTNHGNLQFAFQQLQEVTNGNLKHILTISQAIHFNKNDDQFANDFKNWIQPHTIVDEFGGIKLSDAQKIYMLLVIGKALKSPGVDHILFRSKFCNCLLKGMHALQLNEIPSCVAEDIQNATIWLVKIREGNWLEFWFYNCTAFDCSTLLSQKQMFKSFRLVQDQSWKSAALKIRDILQNTFHRSPKESTQLLIEIIKTAATIQALLDLLKLVQDETPAILEFDNVAFAFKSKLTSFLTMTKKDPRELYEIWVTMNAVDNSSVIDAVREHLTTCIIESEKYDVIIEICLLDTKLWKNRKKYEEAIFNMLALEHSDKIQTMTKIVEREELKSVLEQSPKFEELINTTIQSQLECLEDKKSQKGVLNDLYKFLVSCQSSFFNITQSEIDKMAYFAVKRVPLTTAFELLSLEGESDGVKKEMKLTCVARHIQRRIRDISDQESKVLAINHCMEHLDKASMLLAVDLLPICNLIMFLIEEFYKLMNLLPDKRVQADFESNVTKLVESSKFWLMVLKSQGSESRKIRKHKYYQDIKLILQRLTQDVQLGRVSFTFLHKLDQNTVFRGAVYDLLQAVLPSAIQNFRIDVDVLKNKEKELNANLTNLEMFKMSYANKVMDLLEIHDTLVLASEIQARSDDLKNSKTLTLQETSVKEYWGCLYNLLEYAKELSALTSCSIFLHFCRSMMEGTCPYLCETADNTTRGVQSPSSESFAGENEYASLPAVQIRVRSYLTPSTNGQFEDEPPTYLESELAKGSLDFTTLGKLLSKDCLPKFYQHCNSLLQGDWTISLQIVQNLLKGVTDRGNLDSELQIISAFFKKDIPDDIRQALANFIKIPHIRERANQLRALLQTFGIADEHNDIIHALTTLERWGTPTTQGSVQLHPLHTAVQKISTIDDKLKDEEWNIIMQLANPKCHDLVAFLRPLVGEDLRNLIDAVEERSATHVKESTVSDLINTKRYMEPLLCVQGANQANKIIEAIFKNRTLNMEEQIVEMINTCVNNVHGLKDLYSNVANRGVMTKQVISNALTHGVYTISFPPCRVTLSYERGDTITRYGIDELNDYRSRALLMITSLTSSAENDGLKVTTKDLQTFIDCINTTNEIVDLCTLLNDDGHFDFTEYNQVEKSLKGLRKIRDTLQDMCTSWKKTLAIRRQEFYHLNFFLSKQLRVLDRCFNHSYALSDKEEMEPLQLLFWFVHRDIHVEKEMVYEHQKNMENSNITERLFHLGTVLHKIVRRKSTVSKPIPYERRISQSSFEKTKVQPGSIFVAELENESSRAIQVVLQLYQNTTNILPEPSQILFCHSETAWEEVHLLLLRCKGARNNNLKDKLYSLVNVELLSLDVQIQLIDEIMQMQESSNKEYLLALICRGGSDHHIIDQFSPDYTHRIPGLSQNEMKYCLQTGWKDVEVVTSSHPGLGKTEYVKNVASKLMLGTNTFHVSGPISKKSLIKHFNNLPTSSHKLLHIDVSSMTDPNLFDTFMFELVVIGMVVSGTHMCISSRSEKMLEVANTQQNKLMDALTICSSFKRKHIEWEGFDAYAISEDINSSVQVACSYLDAVNCGELDQKDIVLTGQNKRKPLPENQCRSLLKQYFETGEVLSFPVVKTCLDILAKELRRMSASLFFKIKHLKSNDQTDVRENLVLALVDVSKAFSSRSIQLPSKDPSSRQMIDAAAELAKQRSSSVAAASVMVDRVEGMVKWADNNHLVIVFHRYQSQSLSLLYRNVNEVTEPIKTLFETQIKSRLDYTTKSHDELHKQLEKICRKTDKPLKRHQLGELSRHYALTHDNLLKMVLIHMRLNSHIPVIIMGETGCGKTSLVTYLARVCEITFEPFNLHAGKTESDIIEFVNKVTIEAEKDIKQTVWAFLDEINTCEHLGLLNDIVCHHRCKGKQLPYNLDFVAACNPYSLRKSKSVSAGLPGVAEHDELSKLVYRVHPLPESMMDYVWDFGSLDEKDEKKYIDRMLAGSQKIFGTLVVMSQRFMRDEEKTPYCVSLRDVNRCKILAHWFTNEMFKKKPMRELTKLRRTESIGETRISHAEKILNDPVMRSIILALAHCYQSRLMDEQKRKEYRSKIANIISGMLGEGKDIDGGAIEQVIQAEQDDLLQRMELGKGIAKNEALKENVFVILTSIYNRIPVFVVGKPGCSKSLSMQLIRNNLKGPDSTDDFFKQLPSLYVVSYQGSTLSTSEGIVKVFEKAKKYKEHNPNVLPVVLLDEIGLAEVSSSNPLKVLHSQLEPQIGGFPPVAVVGISNWALDPAKMNRAIHLSRPDPTIDDLAYTAKSIQDLSISTVGASNSASVITKEMFIKIAEAYYEYQKRQKHEHFHGLRDFYCLIKYVAVEAVKEVETAEIREINQTENKKTKTDETQHPDQKTVMADETTQTKIAAYPREIIERGLLRNFGGIKMEMDRIVSSFIAKVGIEQQSSKRPGVIELISDNINDNFSRHLLLITSGDSALTILEETLQGKDIVILFGSKFENDFSDEYNYRVLSEIILCMERGVTLVMKDLNDIYGSLYDMLNQNYTMYGNKRNCRIALGAYSNPMCQVHDKFRCIVLVEQQNIDYTDPPFLNRFEKQTLRFNDVLTSSLQTETLKVLENWLTDISTVEGLRFKREDMFLGLHSDTLPSMVFLHCNNNEGRDNLDEIVRRCKKHLLNIACPDAILRATRSKLAEQQLETVQKLQKEYFTLPLNQGFGYFLGHYIERENQKNGSTSENDHGTFHNTSSKFIVYTHSSIHTNIEKFVPSGITIQLEKLRNFKSERHLTTRIRHFWFNSDKNLLILQCLSSLDAENMLFSKCRIDQYFNEFLKINVDNSKKYVCIIVHIDRIPKSTIKTFNYQWQFNFLHDWQQFTVDSLEVTKPSLEEVLRANISDFLTDDTIVLRNIFRDKLLRCFSFLRYTNQVRSADKVMQLANCISESDHAFDCFQKQISIYLKDQETQSIPGYHNWQTDVACDKELLSTCPTLVNAMLEHVKSCILVPLTKIITYLEGQSAWSGSLFVPVSQSALTATNDETTTFWKTCFEEPTIFNILSKSLPEPNGIESCEVDSHLIDFKFPFFQLFYGKIQNHRDWLMKPGHVTTSELQTADDDRQDLLCKQLKQMICDKNQSGIHEPQYNSYLTSHIDDYFEDVCSLFSAESAPHMKVDSRLQIMKLLLGQLKPITPGDKNPLLSIAQIHVTLWIHGYQLSALLQLISVLEQNRFDDTFNLIMNAAKELRENRDMTLMRERQSYEEERTNTSDEEASLKISKEEGDVNPPQTVHNVQIDNKYSGPHGEHKDEQDGTPSDDIHETNKEENTIGRTDSSSKEESESEQFGDKSVKSRTTFETRLVTEICKSMLPFEHTIKQIGGLSIWQQKVNLVILLAGRVSKESEVLHFLRLCRDVYALAAFGFNVSIEKLSELAKRGIAVDTPLNDYSVFEYVVELIYEMIHDTPDVHRKGILEEFLCMYFCMCLEANLDTCLLPKIFRSLFTESGSPIKGYRSVLLSIIKSDFECDQNNITPFELGKAIITKEEVDNFEEDFPNLQLIDELLAEGEIDSHLASACYDIIEDVTFKNDVACNSLALVNTPEDTFLVLASNAADIILSQSCSLKFVVAGAFLRAFLKSLTELLYTSKIEQVQQGGPYCTLACEINGILRKEEWSSHEAPTLMAGFLKGLKAHSSIYQLKEWCKSYSDSIPTLSNLKWQDGIHSSKLGYNFMAYSERYSEAIGALATWQTQGSDADIDAFINEIHKSANSSIALLAAISEMFYFVRSTSELHDSEKRNAESLLQKLQKTNTFSDRFVQFTKRLLGISDFQGQLKISVATPQEKLEYISVVIHLATIILAQSVDDNAFVSHFLACINQLPDLNEAHLPGMGSPTSALRHDSLVGCQVKRCPYPCGITIVRKCEDLSEGFQCPVCERKELKKVATDPEQGYNLDETCASLNDHRDVSGKSVTTNCLRKLSPVAYRICNIFTHACFLASVSCEFVTEDQMESLFIARYKDQVNLKSDDTKEESVRSTDHNVESTTSTSENICENLIKILSENWTLLKEMICSDHEGVTLFCHNILQICHQYIVSTPTPSSLEEQVRFEERFSELVENEVMNLPNGPKRFKKLCLQSQCETETCLEGQLEEINDVNPAETHTTKPRVLRKKLNPTFQDFQARFINQGSLGDSEYPFLRLFFYKQAAVQCLKHLPKLLQWNRLISSRLNQRITQHEAKVVRIQDFLSKSDKRFHQNDDSCQADVEDFKSFMEAWNSVRDNWPVLSGSKAIFDDMSEDKPVLLCLIDKNNETCPMRYILRTLQKIQNDFLIEALAIASGGATSLSFLMKGPDIAWLYNVPLDEANDEIIAFEWSDNFLDYSDIGTEYGQGCTISYNFATIERSLACELVLNKAILTDGSAFSGITFSDELLHACSSTLSQIKKAIDQETMSTDLLHKMEKEEEFRTSAKDLLAHFEIILVLLKKTGGEPEMPIADYIKRWSTQLPDGFFPEKVVPESVKLKHVIHLYETIEDNLVEAGIRSLSKDFRKALPSPCEKTLALQLKPLKTKDMENMVSIIRRFAFRFLRKTANIDLNHPLLDLMIKSTGDTMDCTPLEDVLDLPQDVSVCHVVTILELIETQIQQLKEQAKQKENRRRSRTSSSSRPTRRQQRQAVKIGTGAAF